MKSSRSAAVERRGRLVGDHQLGRADQRARRGHALLLADRQLATPAVPQRGAQPDALQQRARPRSAASRVARRGPLRGAGREAAGQQHVVEHAQVGQQVELLEDVADMVGAEGVAPRAGQRRPGGAEQADLAGAAAAARRPAGRAACSCRRRWAPCRNSVRPAAHAQRIDGDAVLCGAAASGSAASAHSITGRSRGSDARRRALQLALGLRLRAAPAAPPRAGAG